MSAVRNHLLMLACCLLLVGAAGCQSQPSPFQAQEIQAGRIYDGPIQSGYAVLAAGKHILYVRTGTASDYAVPVRNVGSITDTYTIEVNSESDWFTIPESHYEVTLVSGEEFPVPFLVTLPETAQPGTEAEIVIEAKSHTVINLVDSAHLRLCVATPEQIEAWPKVVEGLC